MLWGRRCSFITEKVIKNPEVDAEIRPRMAVQTPPAAWENHLTHDLSA